MLKKGEKVYVYRPMRWGNRDQYRAGVITKITPTGLIDVAQLLTVDGERTTDYVVRFDKDGREYGRRYDGECLDTEMSFGMRNAALAQLDRIDKAAGRLDAVRPPSERRRYNTKQELIEEVERLQKLLVEANLLVQGV